MGIGISQFVIAAPQQILASAADFLTDVSLLADPSIDPAYQSTINGGGEGLSWQIEGDWQTVLNPTMDRRHCDNTGNIVADGIFPIHITTQTNPITAANDVNLRYYSIDHGGNENVGKYFSVEVEGRILINGEPAVLHESLIAAVNVYAQLRSGNSEPEVRTIEDVDPETGTFQIGIDGYMAGIMIEFAITATESNPGCSVEWFIDKVRFFAYPSRPQTNTPQIIN